MGAGSRVVRYQQRGFAPSHLDGPFTVAQNVEDLFAVLDRFGSATGADRRALVGRPPGDARSVRAAGARVRTDPGRHLRRGRGRRRRHDGGRDRSADRPRRGAAVRGARGSGQVDRDRLGDHADHLAGLLLRPRGGAPAPPMLLPPGRVRGRRGRRDAAAARGRARASHPAALDPVRSPDRSASPINPEVVRATAALFRDAIVQEFDDGVTSSGSSGPARSRRPSGRCRDRAAIHVRSIAR